MEPVRPDYEGPGLVRLVRVLRGGGEWSPEAVLGARSVVLLVLDGLGWDEVQSRSLETLGALDGRPITTVVPSTTAAALTSITTGTAPAEHGVVGYRLRIGPGIVNVLRWSAPGGGTLPDPATFQPRDAFDADPVPVVTKEGFRGSGFSEVHLRGASFHGWVATSAIVEHCRRLVAAGERFVYAYYDGVDIVAHVHGLHDGFFERELASCDRLVGDLLDALPTDVALVVTADHGHVHFERTLTFAGLEGTIAAQSGEARFRYLHAKRGGSGELLDAVTERYASDAWVFSREQLIDERWLGPRAPSPEVARRIGDVIVAARGPVAFADPNNPGEARLLSGHGSLTDAEMLVPLLAGRGRATG